MKLSSDRYRRRGFTLLEAMISMVILSLVLGAAASGSSWTMARLGSRGDSVWATELARSVLDEYRVTGSADLAQGEDPSGYRWQLNETPGAGGLTEVTVRVWRTDSEIEAARLSYLKVPSQ